MPFDVLDPAELIEDFTTSSMSGKRIFLDELDDEERWSDHVDSWVQALRIRTERSRRWVEDIVIRKFLAWEIVLEGRTKHRREMVPVILTVTPSEVPSARRLLGSTQ